MKNLGIRKILITFYSLIPTVLLYVKVTKERLLPACKSVCLYASNNPRRVKKIFITCYIFGTFK